MVICVTKTNSPMKNLSYLVIASCVISFSSCINFGGRRVNGNGHITTDVRSAKVTDRIKVLGSMDVILNEGPSSIKVETDENIIPYIITDVKDGMLEIRTENDVNINTSNKVKVYVTTPSISDINIAGSGNVNSEARFNSNEKINFSISGSGDIDCAVNAPEVDASISGNGDIKLEGETKDVSVHIIGNGDYQSNSLKAENARVNITGSGDVSLFADATLHVEITGSGSVKYKGNATVDKKITGSGSVEKIE